MKIIGKRKRIDGDSIDLSKFNCWFVSAEYYKK